VAGSCEHSNRLSVSIKFRESWLTEEKLASQETICCMEIATWILPSSGSLRGVRWFETDVSELPIGPNFKYQGVRMRPICIAKSLFQNNLPRVTTQKTEKFSSTAAEIYNHATFLAYLASYMSSYLAIFLIGWLVGWWKLDRPYPHHP
jgi:hypothetical protein